MADELREFLTTCDYLGRDIQYAGPEDYAHHLARWFAHIETVGAAADEVRELEARADLDAWFERSSEGGATGSVTGGRLAWSPDEATYLGEQLAICRRISRRELDPQNFVVNFMYQHGRTSPAASIATITQRIFEPMSRDLKRRLLRTLTDEDAREPPRTAPASDRVVRLDHNGADYQTAVAKLDEVDEALRGDNSLDPEIKQQLAKELAAGRSLFQDARVRVVAVRIVLIGALVTLATLLPDFGMNVLADAAILAVQAALRSGRNA